MSTVSSQNQVVILEQKILSVFFARNDRKSSRFYLTASKASDSDAKFLYPRNSVRLSDSV